METQFWIFQVRSLGLSFIRHRRWSPQFGSDRNHFSLFERKLQFYQTIDRLNTTRSGLDSEFSNCPGITRSLCSQRSQSGCKFYPEYNASQQRNLSVVALAPSVKRLAGGGITGSGLHRPNHSSHEVTASTGVLRAQQERGAAEGWSSNSAESDL